MKICHPLAATALVLAQLSFAAGALAAASPGAPSGSMARQPPNAAPSAGDTQAHFDSAISEFAKKRYHAAASDVRAADAVVRKEVAHATGTTQRALREASAGLERTAKALDRGALKSEATMRRAFARADHALALQYRAEAAKSWAGKAYDRTGRELSEAALGLEHAATWAGGEAKTGIQAVAADTRALGAKLASGGTWAKGEVAHGFTSLGNALDRVGHALGVRSKARPFDEGAS